MSTLDELSMLDPDLLESALKAARERAATKAAENWPKCACGAKATQVAYPDVSYVFRALRDRGGRAVINSERSDVADNPPGDGMPEHDVMWVCCDSGACEMLEWKQLDTTLDWG